MRSTSRIHVDGQKRSVDSLVTKLTLVTLSDAGDIHVEVYAIPVADL